MKRSNKEVDRAGDFLRENPEGEKASEMLLIVSEWRSAHEIALKRVMSGLRRQVGKHGWDAVVSGRTKRIRSIVAKLAREPKMTLTQMQDIGGCRVVLDSVENTEILADQMRGILGGTFSAGGEIREKNYIAHPKPDGYRSIHFVVRYMPANHEGVKPRRIEIQIRSGLQHRWATALETVDLFTGQTLKAGSGDPRWQRFFMLSSSIFAFHERRPIVPSTSSDLSDLTREMKDLAKQLHVVRKLQGWRNVMRNVLSPDKKERDFRSAYCYLVELDVDKFSTLVIPYGPEQLRVAHMEYLTRERDNANNPHRSTVLVTAYSLDEVRSSFPGFYGDTKAFLGSAGLV